MCYLEHDHFGIFTMWSHTIMASFSKEVESSSLLNALIHTQAHTFVTSWSRQVQTQGTVPDIVFWPGMNSQIEDTITNCATCATHLRSNPREPLMSHPIPERPWERVGVDLMWVWRRQLPRYSRLLLQLHQSWQTHKWSCHYSLQSWAICKARNS